jgi:hypothetical protein
VLDTVYVKLSGTMPDGPVDKAAWDVTPKYLEDHRFGRIYLIPARHESDRRPRWEAIADLPPHNHNEAALAIVDELVARAIYSTRSTVFSLIRAQRIILWLVRQWFGQHTDS